MLTAKQEEEGIERYLKMMGLRPVYGVRYQHLLFSIKRELEKANEAREKELKFDKLKLHLLRL